jgi:hypothetical protein
LLSLCRGKTVTYFWVTTALVLPLRFAKIFSLFVMTKIAIEAKSVMDKSCRCTQERRKRLEKILHQKFPVCSNIEELLFLCLDENSVSTSPLRIIFLNFKRE